jgi:spore coat protein CotH
MSTVLFSHIARQHIPAPKANFVKVVINGESWGVYVSAQQFNTEFLAENFKTTKGARWKVSGSPNGRGGLDFIGDDAEDYKARYEMKSGNAKDWEALVELCRTLSTTPLDELEAALKPMLDIDSALWFLALDNALINNDGYWVRASDYSIYRDPKGVFHIIPHDMNEAFVGAMGGPMMGGGGPGGGGPGGFGGGPGFGGPGRDVQGGPDRQEGPPGDRPGNQQGPNGEPRRNGPPGQGREGQPGGFQPGGPGGGPGGGMRGAGYELDPLIGMNDMRKPLRSRMLAVPASAPSTWPT